MEPSLEIKYAMLPDAKSEKESILRRKNREVRCSTVEKRAEDRWGKLQWCQNMESKQGRENVLKSWLRWKTMKSRAEMFCGPTVVESKWVTGNMR